VKQNYVIYITHITTCNSHLKDLDSLIAMGSSRVKICYCLIYYGSFPAQHDIHSWTCTLVQYPTQI
jgi:hypothetical protein